jgi:hypothetical protein
MTRLNRDTYVAIFLLAACGIFFWASFDIREPDYGQLSPATWPRLVIGLMSLLSLIYLVQSVRRGPDPAPKRPARDRGLAGFVSHWRNVLWVFALFLVYLLTLPVLGMLLGGTAFVFLLLSALGGWHGRALVVHAIIAVVAVGGMWSLFTYGLGVILPQGEILESVLR